MQIVTWNKQATVVKNTDIIITNCAMTFSKVGKNYVLMWFLLSFVLNSLAHVSDIFVFRFAKIWQTTEKYSPQTFSVTAAEVTPSEEISFPIKIKQNWINGHQ